jgi:FtsH-binding integral membrane protein
MSIVNIILSLKKYDYAISTAIVMIFKWLTITRVPRIDRVELIEVDIKVL